MDVEYLPFFEDEFYLRATNPERWDILVSALEDLREPNDPEVNNRGVSGLLTLLSGAGGEQAGQDDIVPIAARRFAKVIGQLKTDRGRSALMALENAIETHHWKEDCPSLKDCEEQDGFRQQFIREGKWEDTNVAYEHLLQKAVEKEEARKNHLIKSTKRTRFLQNLFAVPLLIMVPIAMFLALIVTAITTKVFEEGFAIATTVLFSIQAAAIWISFALAISTDEIASVQSTRVIAAVASLVLCVVWLVVVMLRSVPPGSSRFIGSNMCLPLALAQLFVFLVNCSLLEDFRKLRVMHVRDLALAFAESATDNS